MIFCYSNFAGTLLWVLHIGGLRLIQLGGIFIGITLHCEKKNSRESRTGPKKWTSTECALGFQVFVNVRMSMKVSLTGVSTTTRTI